MEQKKVAGNVQNFLYHSNCYEAVETSGGLVVMRLVQEDMIPWEGSAFLRGGFGHVYVIDDKGENAINYDDEGGLGDCISQLPGINIFPFYNPDAMTPLTDPQLIYAIKFWSEEATAMYRYKPFHEC
jgi:hypothetical protein